MLKSFRKWRRRRKIKHSVRKQSKLRRILSWSWKIALLLFLFDIAYVITIWPDWDALADNKVPKSKFIKQYEQQRTLNKKLPRIRWQPVPYKWMPKHLRRAVIVAEDSRFYEHHGFDILAFKDAMDINFELGRFKYGASTISQQTVKNLYFSSEKSLLRKWHELILTFGMEWNLKKSRILEVYLNIAEFGEGIYGVEAASKYYFDKSVLTINEYEAAQLAACLPSPKKHNPLTNTKRFQKRADRIYYWMKR